MIALLVALALGALAVLQSWATSSVAPRLGLAPDLGIGLGDSVAVSSGDLALAPARPAVGKGPKPVAAGLTSGEGDGEQAARQAGSGPALALAPARPVSSSGDPREPASPEAAPSPESPPTPATVPVAVPSPSPAPAATSPASAPGEGGGGSPGPVGAGAGPVEAEPGGALEVGEGEEGAFAFSFLVRPSAYRAPSDENLIVRFAGEAGEDPSFALQLWDDGGPQRGLWASGDAMGGERFLAPLADGVWHQVVVDFEASSGGDGFYLVLLDGEPVDARAWVSLIESGNDTASIEVGLHRDGEPVDGSEVLFGPTELGETLESVLP